MDGKISIDVSDPDEDELFFPFEYSTMPCPRCAARAVWMSDPELAAEPQHVCLECSFGFEMHDGNVREAPARVDVIVPRLREQLARG